MKKVIAAALIAASVMGSINIANVYAAESVLMQGSWFESAFIEWNGTQGTEYKAYYKESTADTYKSVDAELVRNISGNSFRADVLGLKGGTSYDIKITAKEGGTERDVAVYTAVPKAYDRSGFAFDGTNDAPGAYNADGTVPDNALILYVSEENKKNVYKNKNIKSIISGFNSLNGGKPVIIRVLGEVTPLSSSDTSPGMWKNTCGVTIEGVGPNAGFVGWGIGSGDNNDTEFRNLTMRDYVEDAIGFENATKLWVHNNNFYSGYNPKDSSAERDKLHGDGSCDLRECNKVTVSYNLFDGTDKTSLIGSSSSSRESTGNITFHHNYFLNTNQRTPRVRWHNIHVYNNYYNGTDAYGVGATCNSSIFAENNYFEDAASPFLTSSQGGFASKFSSNDGGVIKAYNNVMVNCRESLEGVDYFNAPSREYRLTAADFTTKGGGYTYNNFDASGYIANKNYILEDPETAKANVMENAGCERETAIDDMPTVKPPRAEGNVQAVYYFDAPESGSYSAFGGKNGEGTYFTGNISCKANTASGYRDTTAYKYSGSFSSGSAITFTTSAPAKLTMIASSTANAPVRMEVTNKADASAVYHGTFQSGSGGNDVLTTIDLLSAGTYTLTPKSNVDFYYIEVAELGDETPVTEDDFIYGDADNDKQITASDAAFVMQRVLAEEAVIPLQNETENWKKYVDVDGDTFITADDAAKILQKSLTDTYVFPEEE
ncbi:MAG: hypothetical protein IJ062_07495 [Firmicutes bacterium]|nr:hypothetical protein [Bacillota bacterium]